MPVHPFAPLRGRVVEIDVASVVLRENLLGDPPDRRVAVYLPPGYEADPGRRFPLLVDLAAFTGSGLKRVAWRAFEESLPQRVDRLIAAGAMPPVIVAMPDGFTSLGGNQYVDSVAVGRYATWLVDEVVPALDRALRTIPERWGRAVFGKSSGGYAALVHGMRYAERWGAVASHSGDVGFEWCYMPGLPELCTALAPHGGDPAAFVDAVWAAPRLSGGDLHPLMLLAMAATYDPDPSRRYGIRLPMDPHTCEVDPARWAAWLAHDPLRLVDTPGAAEALRGLRLVYLDCGDRDQYHMQYGHRRLARRLAQLGVPHLAEEFPGTHSGVDHRLDVSLPLLARAVSP